MDFLEVLSKIWPVITALVLAIIWMIRLEGKTALHFKLIEQAQNSIDELRIKHESLDNKVVDKLSSIEKALARVEGFLSRAEK